MKRKRARVVRVKPSVNVGCIHQEDGDDDDFLVAKADQRTAAAHISEVKPKKRKLDDRGIARARPSKKKKKISGAMHTSSYAHHQSYEHEHK
jgi:hypothetical protein